MVESEAFRVRQVSGNLTICCEADRRKESIAIHVLLQALQLLFERVEAQRILLSQKSTEYSNDPGQEACAHKDDTTFSKIVSDSLAGDMSPGQR